MKKPLIALVDYEMGNLHSVGKALEKAGGRVQITSSPAAIRRANGVVLPGVGAFGEAARRLAKKHLMDPLREALETNKPFLGICLGLQLLFESSEESPRTKGLGAFKGTNVRFRAARQSRLKIPHMGWNTIHYGPANRSRLLRRINEGDYFYFVHSFYPVPVDPALVATRTAYGQPFCSSIARGRMFACQFHPEKSGDHGQRMLRNFVQELTA